MVDDHSRVAHAVVLPSERGSDCRRALAAHLEWLSERGIEAKRVLTDKGTGYRSHAFADAIKAAGLKHLRTRPRHPQTNGKAEALVGILQREWAYAHIWRSSTDRTRALPGYLRWYNTHRPHGSLGAPPFSRISQAAGPTPSRRQRPATVTRGSVPRRPARAPETRPSAIRKWRLSVPSSPSMSTPQLSGVVKVAR
jgi:transposase InsO family protein